jgi:phospholipid/cholesterol/gamma-HCH transport system substrate-binding protein
MPSLRQVNWAKFRVTMTTIAALAILSVLVYLLTGGTLFRQKTVLFLYLPDAAGVDTTSLVRVNGVDVGKVNAVALSGLNDPNRVIKLTLRIQENYLADIPVDSFAQLSAENPLGQEYVDITRGTSSRRVRPGAEIALKPQPELFKNLSVLELEQRLRAIDALMTDIEQGRNGLGRLLQTDDLYNDLRARIAGLDRVVRTAASPTSVIGRLAYTDQLYREFRAPFAAIDATLARIQSGQGTLGRLLREDGEYREFTRQLADLEKSVTGARSSPFLQSDEQYVAWNRALGSLIRALDTARTNPLLMTSDIYDNLNGMLSQMRGTVRDFREHPEKFLRIKVF